MSVSFAELKPVFDVLRATYKNRDTLTMLLAFGGPGRALDDYVGPNDSMPSVYLKVVSAAANQGWLTALMDAVLNDTTLTEDRRAAIRADWSGLLRRIDPEPGFEHWQHLRTDGAAFVNRTTLRKTVSDMLNVLGPRVLVLKGNPLSGTSYTWRLISHIARSDASTQCTFFDFATWKGDPRPLGVMEAIAAHLALDATPRRADMPSDDHLAAFLVTWLVGQLQQLEGMRWLVFDNAHATVLPQATKEMIAGLADALSRGTVDNARMFVLGFDLALIGHSNARALELRLTRLGQPDFEEYLASVAQRFGGLGGEFANPTEVLDEVFSDVSLDAADRVTLEAISAQLDRIVHAAQEAGAPAPGAQ